MTKLLIRTLRRLASVEDSVYDFAKTNFRKLNSDALDLTLSVYEVEDDERQVTQARTEHRASFSDPPEPVEASLALDGFPEVDVAETPGETMFRFTRHTHREMNFFDDSELLAMAEVVRNELSTRQRFTSAEAMWIYVRQRLDEEDPEWGALCGKKRKWRKWVKSYPCQAPLPGMGDEEIQG